MNNFLLFIYLIFILFIYKYKNKYTISFIFSVYWFLNMFIGEVLFNDYSFSYEVYLLLFSSSIFLFFGELIGFGCSSVNTINIVVNEKKYYKFLYLSILIGVSYSIFSLWMNNISINNLFHLDGFLKVNHEMAELRYNGEQKRNLLLQLTLVFIYLSPLLAGFILGKNFSKKIIIISLIPSLIVLLTTNTKSVFISSVFLLVASYVSYNILINGKLPKFKMKYLFFTVLISIFLYIILLVSFFARAGRIDIDLLDTLSKKFMSYVAHMPALNHWLVSDYLSCDSFIYSFGNKTFFGISNLIGVAERKIGVFSDYYSFQSNGIDITTNVYSAYRFHIEDFGIIGCLLFLFLIGLISSFTRRKIKKDFYFSLTIISLFITYILNSFVYSVFAYTSYLMAFILFYIIIHLSIKEDTYV